MKKLALLAIIPFLSMLFVPMASVAAKPHITVDMGVSCNSDEYPVSATITYAGHTYSVSCFEGSTEYDNTFTVAKTTGWVMTGIADGVNIDQTGKFGPTHVGVSGSQYGYLDSDDNLCWWIHIAEI